MIINQQPGVSYSIDGQSNHMDEGAVIAAIATAIFEMTDDTFDIESTVHPKQKITHRRSRWNSKIYGLRQFLRH